MGPVSQEPQRFTAWYAVGKSPSLDDCAFVWIDFDGHRVVNPLITQIAKRPDTGDAAAAPIRIAGNTMMEGCAFGSKLRRVG